MNYRPTFSVPHCHWCWRSRTERSETLPPCRSTERSNRSTEQATWTGSSAIWAAGRSSGAAKLSEPRTEDRVPQRPRNHRLEEFECAFRDGLRHMVGIHEVVLREGAGVRGDHRVGERP